MYLFIYSTFVLRCTLEYFTCTTGEEASITICKRDIVIKQ